MSKKSRMSKMLQTLQSQLIEMDRSKGVKKSKTVASPTTLNVSTIAKASFLDECDAYGNPLHSTALEDDFSPNICSQETTDQEGSCNGGGGPSNKANAETPTTTGNGQLKGRAGKAVQRKETLQKKNDQNKMELKPTARAQKEIDRGKSEEDLTEAQSGAPASQKKAPASQKKAPASKKKAPVSQKNEPVSQKNAPVSQKNTPASQKNAPASQKNAPAFQKKAPASQNKEPTSQKKAPPTKKKAPASQNKAPTSQKKAPPTQKKAPTAENKEPTSQKKTPARKELDTDIDASRTVNEEKGDSSVSSPGSGSQVNKRKRRVSLSSEELTDEDNSWQPSKKPRPIHQGQKRKSSVEGARRKSASSDSSQGSTRPSNRDERRHKNVTNPSGLNVVLDSFLEFVSEYMDTLDSGAVKQAIRALSSSFEDQLIERITASKELKFLKRENIKMNALINRKRARLLQAKNELIRSESQLRALQKDQSELEQRLADLRKGTTFLKNLSHLHKTYQEYRTAHPDQEDKYGPSSLPALLLETRDVFGTEDQLKTVNERLQQALDQVPS